MNEESKKLLYAIYDSYKNNNFEYIKTREEYDTMENNEKRNFKNAYNFLENNGYIKSFKKSCFAIPFACYITDKGIAYFEADIFNSNSIAQNITNNTFNLNGNNNTFQNTSFFGNVNDSTIYNNDLKAITEAIEKLNITNNEKDKLNEEIKNLISDLNLSKPIKQGMFSKISEHFKNHNELYEIISNFLINYLFNK